MNIAYLGIFAAAAANAVAPDISLERLAQGINAPREAQRIDIRNAVVDGTTLNADIINADALELSPEQTEVYVRQVICANPAMRGMISNPAIRLHFNVHAPNWHDPVPATVAGTNCEASAVSDEHANTARSAPPAPRGTFDFKGVPLGISYDEFRRLPHPDGFPAQIVCTGERVTVGRLPMTPLDVSIFNDLHVALGVRKCVWINTAGDWAGRMAGLGLAGSSYATNEYSFSFVPDPSDGVLRLFQFEGITNRLAEAPVLQALTAKFGNPNLSRGTVQNGIGNNFDQTTAIWSDATGSLIVQSPAREVNKMTIVMTDARLSDFIAGEDTARRAAIPNGI